MKPVRPIAFLAGHQLSEIEDATERLDGLLEAIVALDWGGYPGLDDGRAAKAVAFSALSQVSIIEKAMERIREIDAGETP